MSEETRRKIIREYLEKYMSIPRNEEPDIFSRNKIFFSEAISDTKPTNIVLIDTQQTSNYSNLDKKLNKLYEKVDGLSESVESIKSTIYESETTKEEAIIYFKEKINIIKEVKKVYCKQDAEGISFWIFFKTKNTSSTLTKIVNIEIDVDSKYPNIYFNFYVDPLNETLSKFERKQWSPLISRG
jgi:hypothetical protein